MLSRGEQYDQAFGFLVDAFRRAKRTLPNGVFVPALVDFTATVGFAADGEAGIREMVAQLMRRGAEAQEGRFPTIDDEPGEESDPDSERDDARVAAIHAIIAAGDNPYYPRLARALQLYKRRIAEAADHRGNNSMLVSEDNTEDIVATDGTIA
jgi:hypothetical protein